jgi:uroporphyrinogen decarboxylase
LGVDFRLIPQFEEKVLEHRDGHYVVQDWKGNVCEISDDFDVTYLRQAKDFVTRRWIRCPVETREDWNELRQRYQLDSPGRFPDEFVQRCTQAKGREWVLQISFPGPFWIMREWCGFEGLCMMMVEQPDLVEEMSDFWRGFVSGILEQLCRHVTPDAVFISEDMAYKGKSMISMDMARGFCMPCWRDWSGQLRSAGVPIIDMDSDGFIGELIPLWIEAGINVCDPLEVAAGCDIVEMRQRFGHSIAFRQGVDKRAIAAGGQALQDELSRIEPVVKDGGYIPGCDHGVPPDISWPNFVDYSRRLAEMTGWL